jgi:hypothetical protein
MCMLPNKVSWLEEEGAGVRLVVETWARMESREQVCHNLCSPGLCLPSALHLICPKGFWPGSPSCVAPPRTQQAG